MPYYHLIIETVNTIRHFVPSVSVYQQKQRVATAVLKISLTSQLKAYETCIC